MPPVNDLCAGAIDLGTLPFSDVLDTTTATDDAATPDSEWGSGDSRNGIWFTWTPLASGLLRITLQDAGGEGVLTIFRGSCGSLVDTLLGGYGTPGGHTETAQLEGGETYYFLVTSYDPGGVAALSLSLAFEAEVDGPVPVGSIVVVNAPWITFLSAVDGSELKRALLPQSPYAVVDADGVFAAEHADGIHFYDADLTHLAGPVAIAAQALICDPDDAGRFYFPDVTFGAGAYATAITRISKAGSVLDTWSIPNYIDGGPSHADAHDAFVVGLAISPDGTTAYYLLYQHEWDNQLDEDGKVHVYAYDLVNEVQLADFIADVGAGDPPGLLALQSGDVLLYRGSFSNPLVIKRYNSSGVLQTTYADLSAVGTPVNAGARVFRGVDATSFWVYLSDTTPSPTARLVQVETATGTLLTDLDITATTSFTPADFAGYPWFVTRVAIGVPVPIGFTRRRAFRGLEGPLYWSRLAHRDTDGTPKAFPWAPISIADPADYYDGFKDELLLSVGDLSFPLSDRRGLVQVPTCDVTYSDLPGRTGLMQLRGMLGRDTQKALKFKEFTIYCTTDEDRRAKAAPAIAFRGFVDRCDGDPDYDFTIHAKGWIARRLGEPLWDDTIGDIFPDAPNDTATRAVPIAFGHLSDEESDTAAPVFVTDEAGRGGHGEPDAVSSYGDMGVAAPTGLNASEAVGQGNINLGDNPGDQYVIFATRVVGGVEGDREPFDPETATPVVITADSAAIDASCDNDGADAYRFYIARVYFGVRTSHYIETTDPVTGVRFTDFPTLASQGGIPITPGAVFAEDPFRNAVVVAVMTDGTRTARSNVGFVVSKGFRSKVRLAWGAVTGADYYELYLGLPVWGYQRRFDVPASQTNSNGDPYWEWDWSNTGFARVSDVAAPIGVIAPIHCGKFLDLLGFGDWDGFLISGRPCVEFEGAYISGTRLDDAQYGPYILAPGKPGYTAAFGSLPFTANGYTPTMVFVRLSLRDRILGLNGFDPEPFRVNVKGHANLANTDVETSIYEQLRMIAKNAVLTDAPSIQGAFDQEPVFTDGTPRLDDISLDQAAFDALQVMPGGPAAARWLPGDVTVDQFFQDLCPSGKLKVGIKPNGQMVAAVHNPSADVVDTLEERFDVVDRGFRFQVSDQGFANATPYQYATYYDEFGQIVFQVASPAEDAVSQSSDQYGARLPDSPIWSFAWRRSAPLAAGVARAFLEESRYMPQPADVESMLHMLQRAPGETVALTHRQGATATGYTARKHAVLGMRIALMRLTVGFTLLDLRTSVGELSFFQHEDFMAGRWIGGARDNVCQTLSGVVVPYNSHTFVINWDEIPGTHGQRARIFSAVSGGGGKAITPAIFLEGEDPSGDTSVVQGSSMTSAAFDEQLLEIPRSSGEVRYWLLPILGGGAAAGDAKIFGFLEGYRL